MIAFLRFRQRKNRVPMSVLMPVPSRPAPISLKANTVPLSAYEKLSGELEFYPARLLEVQLLSFLAEQNIPVYDYEQVDAYMTHVARQDHDAYGHHSRWIWRPLREKDVPPFSLSGHARGCVIDLEGEERAEREGHGSYHKDAWGYGPYDKAVPMPILLRVQKVENRFGQKVFFFVSDLRRSSQQSYDGDPFIMVTASDMRPIIFGIWDEPGFGEAQEAHSTWVKKEVVVL